MIPDTLSLNPGRKTPGVDLPGSAGEAASAPEDGFSTLLGAAVATPAAEAASSPSATAPVALAQAADEGSAAPEAVAVAALPLAQLWVTPDGKVLPLGRQGAAATAPGQPLPAGPGLPLYPGLTAATPGAAMASATGDPGGVAADGSLAEFALGLQPPPGRSPTVNPTTAAVQAALGEGLGEAPALPATPTSQISGPGGELARGLLPGTAPLPGQAPSPGAVTPGLELPTPMGQGRWADELGERVLWMVDARLQRAAIKLNPAGLGPVEVEIRMAGEQQAQVQFHAAQPATREALEASLPRLREMFAAQGMTLLGAEVGSGQTQAGQGEAGGGGTGSGSAGADSGSPERATALPGAWSSLPGGQASGVTGLLDTYA